MFNVHQVKTNSTIRLEHRNPDTPAYADQSTLSRALKFALAADGENMQFGRLMALCALLAGCATAPLPYPNLSHEGSAKLHVEETTAFQYFFMPDGDKCGSYLSIAPNQNPFLREDKTMLLEPSKRSAMQFVWSGTNKGLGACWVIVSFRLVPNGEYKLHTSYNGETCVVGISPLNKYSAEGFELRQMEWTGFKVPSECKVKSE